jgi:dTDP-4-dehydrorhamnose reductase
MQPIVGLVHHGSGPSFTSLLDPEFPYFLSAYSYEVANRYPWIEEYTPVNEPLTTARFSGLYGLWYPHYKNDLSFYRMLLNQLKGTVMSMEAIRSVNPSARLIQTEDLGKTFSTPLLAYQANFENERRLLTFDILTGLLQPGHPQFEYMIGCGIRKEEINYFQLHRLPPDVLGLNYYVTSERWLDESLEKYNHHTYGGNGVHQYADTEVVRTNIHACRGFKNLAAEIWERYKIPMAVTECHIHCTREEQLRWFKEVWDDAITLNHGGIPIQGVTAWALFGSFDWDTLLTKTGSQYESGVFDIKTFAGKLRPTALTKLLKALAAGETEYHPVLTAPGWWHDSSQITSENGRPVIVRKGQAGECINKTNIDDISALLISACDLRRIPILVLTNPDESTMDRLNPWAIINLGSTDTRLKSSCQRKQLQYVSFCKEEPDQSCLNIVVEKMPFTIHQVNKVLDLMIDGDKGRWVFTSDGIVFKMEDLMGSATNGACLDAYC